MAPDAFKPTVYRDTSAAMIATYGMLLLHQAHGLRSKYLQAALHILDGVLKTSLAPKVHFSPVKGVGSKNATNNGDTSSSESVVMPKHETNGIDGGAGAETILLHATINNYEYAPRRWADHGLVYADYYFVKVGNLLCEMGIA